jgi:dihydrodipicolinate synthase/N-acetylneuraminate lyase
LIDPFSLFRPRRKPEGISAILLPFDESGAVDWAAFAAHVARTADAGLIPAVNMDTGYVNFLDERTRLDVLERTRSTLAGTPFVAGAFVADNPGDTFDRDAYRLRIDEIQSRGGTPVIFQSFGLIGQDGPSIVESYRALAKACDRFIGFELTGELAPFGAIYDLETYAGLMDIPQCIGAKHSSFHREPEWRRLALRNERRPDFKVYTGNDLAIDMIMYGSDYLLGLSTFAPDLFARRDAYWEAGDPAFFELNDQLQYLGFLAFRVPGPAYKHSAAQFLKLRGWIASDRTHPQNPTRPASDVELLRELGLRMGVVHPADRRRTDVRERMDERGSGSGR